MYSNCWNILHGVSGKYVKKKFHLEVFEHPLVLEAENIIMIFNNNKYGVVPTYLVSDRHILFNL